jgi:transposase
LEALERFVIELCPFATIFHVAVLLRMGWDSVQEIYQGHLEERLARRTLWGVRSIAVDEFAIRKGHRYLTMVMDLDEGAIRRPWCPSCDGSSGPEPSCGPWRWA